eukprot:3755328-Rhodomonas_salina.3
MEEVFLGLGGSEGAAVGFDFDQGFGGSAGIKEGQSEEDGASVWMCVNVVSCLTIHHFDEVLQHSQHVHQDCEGFISGCDGQEVFKGCNLSTKGGEDSAGREGSVGSVTASVGYPSPHELSLLVYTPISGGQGPIAVLVVGKL